MDLLHIPLIVKVHNDKPAIEMRVVITEPEKIKLIVSAAFHNQPIIIVPNFTYRIKSLASLLEKGIVYRDEKGEFRYLI